MRAPNSPPFSLSRDLRPSFFAFSFFPSLNLPLFLRAKPFFFFVPRRAHTLSLSLTLLQKRTRAANVRAFPPILTAHIPPATSGESPREPHEKYSTIFKLVPEHIQTGARPAQVEISENWPPPPGRVHRTPGWRDGCRGVIEHWCSTSGQCDL